MMFIYLLDSDVCSLHWINGGLRVSGNNMTVEWQGTGPTASNKIAQFSCRVDRMQAIPCELIIIIMHTVS